MDIVSLIISLVGGAIGGNVAGPATQDKNLGVPGNTIAGLIGGPLGTYIMQALGLLGATTAVTAAPDVAAQVSATDWTELLKTLLAGGGSGAVVTALVALIKDAMNKKM
ncbi:MAG: hypothetical protein LLF94_00920 [Chlamydiales bacterium]|nr:hypothetical protein [Chlamydiales bacterium]